MVSSLAKAPSGLTFGQLIRGEGDEAKKVIRRLFNSRPRRPVSASIGTLTSESSLGTSIRDINEGFVRLRSYP